MNEIMSSYNCYHINNSFRNFGAIQNACLGAKNIGDSSRSPRMVQKAAIGIGMIIPPKLRQGIKAYNYFVEQFRYYHDVIYHEYAQATVDNVNLLSDSILLSYLPKSVGIWNCSSTTESSNYSVNTYWTSRLDLENKVRSVLLEQALIPLNWNQNIYYYAVNNMVYTREEIDTFPIHNGYLLLTTPNSQTDTYYVRCI